MRTAKENIEWFKTTFNDEIINFIKETPYSIHLISAIAYQETGYIWSKMVNQTSLNELLETCVGDTLDRNKTFPRNRDDLLAVNDGQKMYLIAREALQKVAMWVDGYKSVANNPLKFCKGFGIFQYDLQFFLNNPSFFLEKKWTNFNECIYLLIDELVSAQNRIPSLKNKSNLSDIEQIYTAIAYNSGGFDSNLGLKQGYKTDELYYGELIQIYYNVSMKN